MQSSAAAYEGTRRTLPVFLEHQLALLVALVLAAAAVLAALAWTGGKQTRDVGGGTVSATAHGPRAAYTAQRTLVFRHGDTHRRGGCEREPVIDFLQIERSRSAPLLALRSHASAFFSRPSGMDSSTAGAPSCAATSQIQ